tara:strand:- start:242 stop:433 length:192 start_codon:yes stop_codon:yes gene_type:complete
MPHFICKCENKELKETRAAHIKIIDGEASYGVDCSCGKPMALDPDKKKTGHPSFSSNRWGQVR